MYAKLQICHFTGLESMIYCLGYSSVFVNWECTYHLKKKNPIPAMVNVLFAQNLPITQIFFLIHWLLFTYRHLSFIHFRP